MRTLQAEPLTCTAFAPFGDVIQTEGAQQFPINQGSTTRFHDLAAVQLHGEAPRALISIFRGRTFALPFEARMLERHPLGSQAFVPLDRRPYLVLVAPPGDAPRPEALRVFRAEGDQGVNYHAGTWHHPLLALEAESEFLVIDRGGPGHNCDEAELSEPVRLIGWER